MVAQVIKTVGAHEMLDYGAGKGRLGVALEQHLDQELKIYHTIRRFPRGRRRPRHATLLRVSTCSSISSRIYLKMCWTIWSG